MLKYTKRFSQRFACLLLLLSTLFFFVAPPLFAQDGGGPSAEEVNSGIDKDAPADERGEDSAVNITDRHLQEADQAAAEFFQARIDENPDAAENFGALAVVLLNLGQYAEAKTNAEKALQLDPKNALAAIAMLTIYSKDRNYKSIVSVFEAVDRTKIFAASLPGHLHLEEIVGNLGYAYMMVDRNSDVLAVLKAGRDADPENELILTMLENYYVFGNATDTALSLIESELKKSPDDLNLLIEKGRLLYLLKRYPEAEKILLQATTIKPGYLKPWYFLHRINLDNNQMGKATEYFNRCKALVGGQEQIVEELEAQAFFPHVNDLIEGIAAGSGNWQSFGQELDGAPEDKPWIPFFEQFINESYYDEAGLKYYIMTQPYQFVTNSYLQKLDLALSPKTSKGQELFQQNARLMMNKQFDVLLSGLNEGIALEPDCVGFYLQGMMAAKMSGKYAQAYSLYQKALKQNNIYFETWINENPTRKEFLAAITSFLTMNWVKDPNWQNPEAIFASSYPALSGMFDKMDLVTEHALLHLLMGDMASDCGRYDLIPEHERGYLKCDPDLEVLRWFVMRYGVYFFF